MIYHHGERESRRLAARLAKIEGHTRAIAEMIRADRDCLAVVHQIRSVIGAWQQVATCILDEHLKTCVRDAVASGRAEEAIESLRESLLNKQA
jgi:DNA-binding FrmR family transcriptional regulator